MAPGERPWGKASPNRRRPTPAFKPELQNRGSGVPHEDSSGQPHIPRRSPITGAPHEDSSGRPPIPRQPLISGASHEDSSGRPPIPRQPPIPERPADDPGSEGEDGDEEAPQVVALEEGKHLSAWEVENEKRKGES